MKLLAKNELFRGAQQKLRRENILQTVTTIQSQLRNLKFPKRWTSQSRSSELWRREVLWLDTNVWEVHAADHNTTQGHNPEVLDL
jgi:glycerol-3-phosphate O-acyltransferase